MEKKKFKIELEDNGQDFLEIYVEDGIITETKPFQTSIWKGAYIPVMDVDIGEELPIHNPPHINYGYLKHKVIAINEI